MLKVPLELHLGWPCRLAVSGGDGAREGRQELFVQFGPRMDVNDWLPIFVYVFEPIV
jgi:hypothetical protein